MLFMVIEHFRAGRAPDVYRRFRDRPFTSAKSGASMTGG